MISALFEQVATRSKLEPLGLVEILDWTAGALNRVDRAAFFSKFEEGHAVQYFYEPFLEAFDPELRKDLGVWYTPPEVVQYMVARVDTVLREELDIADGLADPRVYVLDPCCGTGAFLVEVLRRIGETLKAKGGDALVSQDLKQAAMKRVFGFEILPAPFVVSHLQLGLVLQNLGAPLAEKKSERVGVYLTNALTGWEPPKGPKIKLLFPELEEERDAAEKVKRETPILVILGNPPYNGYAGMAIGEERTLSTAYRTAKKVAQPQGQGLNELYVRFFRMAERRIVEMNRPAKGVVCFISNYSWLDGLSHTAMRERYWEVFDRVWVDNLHGDRIISEYAPDGRTSETIFAIKGQSPGIKIGTSITTLVRGEKRGKTCEVLYRDVEEARADARRQHLLESLNARKFDAQYQTIKPVLELGLPLKPGKVSTGYLKWPLLSEIFPYSSPGITTARDEFLVSIDKDSLVERITLYFDPEFTDAKLKERFPKIMKDAGQYGAIETRRQLQKRGILIDRVVRFFYRPFDVRWLYLEPSTYLIDRKRDDYVNHVFPGNLFFTALQRNRKDCDPPLCSQITGAYHLVERGANFFPLYLSGQHASRGLFDDPSTPGMVPNVSTLTIEYLKELNSKPETLFLHTLAILHANKYGYENAGALRQDWPRVPLPKQRKTLEASAALGTQLAELLDPETPTKGVTSGTIRKELTVLGSITRDGGGSLDPDAGDLALTTGWGHAGKEGVTMPGKGKAVAREYTPAEKKALEDGAAALGLSRKQVYTLLGENTYDVYLNGKAFWRNVPENVWEYTLGGYQVIKKWLSFREKELLGRDLTLDEAREVTNIVRRIAAILLLSPNLDANYEACK